MLSPILTRVASYAFDRRSSIKGQGNIDLRFSSLRTDAGSPFLPFSVVETVLFVGSGEGAGSSLNVLPREWDGQAIMNTDIDVWPWTTVCMGEVEQI